MQKDFDNWNIKKKTLDKKSQRLLIKEGQIWWCSIGVNVGEEVFGKGSNFRRPVIILRKVTGNSCIAIPTTSQKREGSWYHKINIHGIERFALMHQIRFISANRLSVRESELPAKDLEELKKSVGKFLGL